MKNVLKTLKRSLAIAISGAVCVSSFVFGGFTAAALDPLATGAKGADLSCRHWYYRNDAAAAMKDAGWVSYLFNEPTTPEGAVSSSGKMDISENFVIDNGEWNKGYLKVENGKISSSQAAAITYPQKRFKNFRAEYNVAVGWTRGGIMIGENGVFPLSKDNDSSNDTGLVVFVETDGQINIAGAVVAGSGKSIGGSNEDLGTNSDFNNTNSIRTRGTVATAITPAHYLTTDNYEKGTRTIVVEVTNGLVTVWDKETPKARVSARLTEYYQGGYISFYTNSNNNSFISINVTELNDYDFEYGAQYWVNNAASYNDKMAAYTFDRATYEKKSEGTFSSMATFGENGEASKGYLKYNQKDNCLTAFTYTENKVIDFKAKVALLPSYDYNGLMFGGEKGVFALGSATTNDDTGVIIRMDGSGNVLVYGAIEPDTARTSNERVTASSSTNTDFPNHDKGLSVTGLTKYVDADGNTQTKSVNINKYADSEGIDTQVFSLCVQVVNRTLKIWEESYPENYVTVVLGSGYSGGYVSMFSRTYNNGSFRGFGVTALGGFYKKLQNADLASLDQDFESYYYSNQYAIPVKADKVSDQWWTTDAYDNKSYGEIHGAYRKNDLKVRHGIDKPNWTTTILTYKNNGVNATNFKASVGYHLNWTAHGIMVSSNNTIPWDNNAVTGATNPTGVLAYVSSNKEIMVFGAVNGETAVATGSGIGENKATGEFGKAALKLNNYSDTTEGWGGTIDKGVTYNIVMEIVGSKLKVYVAELADQVLEVELNAGYQGGKVSAFSLGCNQGGITSFSYEDLEPETTANANVSFNTKVKGNYTYVTLVSDTDGKFAGNVTFDATKREYVGAVNKELVFNRNISAVLAEEGKVNLEAYGLRNNDAVTLVFTASSIDISDIAYNPIFTVGGVPAEVITSMSLLGDVNGDIRLDICDLVRYKKWQADNATDISDANFDINEDGVKDAADIAYLRKTLLGANNAAIESSLIGKSGLFLGDSIAYGAGDSLRLSWGGRLRAYGLDSETVAVSGWALTPKETSGREAIVTQLENAKKSAYDFVILEGGVNDILINRDTDKSIAMGKMTASDNFTEFDTTTVAGALEDLIAKTKAKFPEAKVGYIINCRFANIDDETYAEYVSLAKDICDKWEISSVSLDGLIDTTKGTADQPDGLHPSAQGYDKLVPTIYNWMNNSSNWQ